jgi:branched-chain amino acid transport system permease protein
MSVLENVALGAHVCAGKGALRSLARLDRDEERCLMHEAATQIERVGVAVETHRLTGSLSIG